MIAFPSTEQLPPSLTNSHLNPFPPQLQCKQGRYLVFHFFLCLFLCLSPNGLPLLLVHLQHFLFTSKTVRVQFYAMRAENNSQHSQNLNLREPPAQTRPGAIRKWNICTARRAEH